MKRLNLYVVLVLLLFSLFVSVGCSKDTKKEVELNISAAASLTEVMGDIATYYSENHPDVKIILNLGSSGSLQQQIEQGAPVDVFLSASKNYMTKLEEKDLLLDNTNTDLLKNEVVLIVPSDSTTITSFDDIATDKVTIFAMGEPESVPAGKYGKEVLTYLGIYDNIVLKTVLAKNVKEILAWVESGDADSGVVYFTDAINSDKVKIIANAPDGSHSDIIYPVAVIKASENQEEAKIFIDFLSSEKGKAIFSKYGFK